MSFNQETMNTTGEGVKNSPSEMTLISARQPSATLTKDEWENMKDYMQIKERKLLSQFHGIGHKLSDIFNGVSIYVNGFTDPSADELKRLIHDHGGTYCYYYSPSKVTHIITYNLPDTKVKNLSAGTIVCTPSWVVDSIAAEKALPVVKYRLYHRATEQGSLKFSSKGKGPASGSAIKKAKLMDDITIDASASNLGNTGMPTSAAGLISEFYTHSRLHHLSLWSAKLKEYAAKVRTEITPKLKKLSTKESLKRENSQVFVHIDLDCFFVSVGLRDRPHLLGKPVAVSHFKGSTSKTEGQDRRLPTESLSDIASCNYEARDRGVRNGMSVGKGLQRCPELIIIPYEFEKYQSVSQIFYETVLSFLPEVEAVSCDEAYIELTDYVTCVSEACEIVETLRKEIFDKTQCHASAGISHNMLLARLSTRVAKPCGQFCLLAADAAEFLSDQLVSNLPGVGYSTASKLNSLGITNCQQLSQVPLSKLHTQFGKKIGTSLYNFARGIDNRSLTLDVERKSLSADVNFGIRFQSASDANEFIANLAKEVERRALDNSVIGKQVTLKLKIRRADVPTETKKYLGHGICDNLSKSKPLPTATCKAATLEAACIQMINQLSVPVVDIRGIGIQLTKLTSCDEKVAYADLRKTFARHSVPVTNTSTSSTCVKPAEVHSLPSNSLMNESFDIPPASQLDASVFEALPDEYKAKISALYARERVKEASRLEPINGSKDISQVPLPVHDLKSNVIINHMDNVDILVVFSYLRNWLQHSKDNGPVDSDVKLFTDYILNLLNTHMDVVYGVLRYLWRKIDELKLAPWKPAFVQLLSSVQEAMLEKYDAMLNLDFICDTNLLLDVPERSK